MRKFLLLGVVMLTFAACGGGSTTPADDGVTEVTTTDGTSTVATEAAISASMDAMGNSMGDANPVGMTIGKFLKEAIPQVPISYTYNCTGSGDVDWTGTLDIDVTMDGEDLQALAFDFILGGVFDGCSVEDDTTTDFDESDVVLDGDIDSVTNFDMAFGSTMTLTIGIGGEFTVSGVCDAGGTLILDLDATVSGNAPANAAAAADFDFNTLNCEISGSVTGTVCDETVDATVDGDCYAPTIAAASDDGGNTDGDDDTVTADPNNAVAAAGVIGSTDGVLGMVSNFDMGGGGPPAMIVPKMVTKAVVDKAATIFKDGLPVDGAEIPCALTDDVIDKNGGTITLAGSCVFTLTDDATIVDDTMILVGDLTGGFEATFAGVAESATVGDTTYEEELNGTATIAFTGTNEAHLADSGAGGPESVDFALTATLSAADLAVTGDVEGDISSMDLEVTVSGDMTDVESFEYSCDGTVTATVDGEEVECNVKTNCSGCDEE